jgi:(heptosyl)LPS beta-1,4-glucosyltransferase
VPNTAKRQSLGVVAICYNEQRDLPGFLENLLGWVDEIVLVDDGSTDDTPALAANAGDKVTFIRSPRRPGEYYSHQRNKGIARASSDWLLHMDIDERVTPELAEEILESINNPNRDAYRFRRLNFFLHRPMRGGGWQKWNMVHFAKRHVLRFGGMFHETCELNVPPSRIGQLESPMWHLNDATYIERMGKSAAYCLEDAERLRKSGRRIHWFHLVIVPPTHLLARLIAKRGIADGVPGLLSSIHSSCARFRALAIIWDEQHRLPRSELEKRIRRRWEEARIP